MRFSTSGFLFKKIEMTLMLFSGLGRRRVLKKPEGKNLVTLFPLMGESVSQVVRHDPFYAHKGKYGTYCTPPSPSLSWRRVQYIKHFAASPIYTPIVKCESLDQGVLNDLKRTRLSCGRMIGSSPAPFPFLQSGCCLSFSVLGSVARRTY